MNRSAMVRELRDLAARARRTSETTHARGVAGAGDISTEGQTTTASIDAECRRLDAEATLLEAAATELSIAARAGAPAAGW